ncbi:hypothetical protein G6F40_014903 [Rhizopus arrhizus]|nr:hypothetical protein G6F40_014903 [Rhizopus arrhizus]
MRHPNLAIIRSARAAGARRGPAAVYHPSRRLPIRGLRGHWHLNSDHAVPRPRPSSDTGTTGRPVPAPSCARGSPAPLPGSTRPRLGPPPARRANGGCRPRSPA